ncbi:MAG: phosphatase PAP2 family protein [Treponema sp.]|nr:phosphatase PAP2 family protein [Treponema sp.]
MKKFFILCSVAALACGSVSAESMYTYDLTKDIVIGSVSAGLAVSSLFIDRAANNASKDDIPSKDSVNAFDRGLMTGYNKPIDLASDFTTYGLLVLPVVSLAGNFRDAYAWLTYGIMYAESAFLVFGTSEVLKNSIPRYRPYSYYGDAPAGSDTDYYKSFPSRHTAFAFMSAGFVTATFFTEYPDSKWKIPLSAAAYTLAVGVGAGRIFSGNHFLSDVLAGAAIGSLYGYLIPWLHERKKQDGVTLAPLPNGLIVTCKF